MAWKCFYMKPQGFLAQATYRITAAALQTQNIVRSELQAKLIKFQINLVLKSMLGSRKGFLKLIRHFIQNHLHFTYNTFFNNSFKLFQSLNVDMKTSWCRTYWKYAHIEPTHAIASWPSELRAQCDQMSYTIQWLSAKSVKITAKIR